ncbi:hypothetical protein JIG36_37935 [Actinoplanes sp. LDG1-06]|uniref:HIG1 domain-containing protein n=1 Tax=Paractinoplanes ovalisporus TaxID=2810368 RepID=A0ABS2AN58_9ACTN|nr:hypothetical protein [Actinoplanes ovalisporus]MBM2621299.1 hypothetical protein [Actinoplanes ovalisporus]
MRILSLPAAAETSSWAPLIWAAAFLLVVIGAAFLVVTLVGLGDGKRGRHARSQQRQLIQLILAVLTCLTGRQPDRSDTAEGER